MAGTIAGLLFPTSATIRKQSVDCVEIAETVFQKADLEALREDSARTMQHNLLKQFVKIVRKNAIR